MDAVITYVNGADPLWLEDYCRAVHEPALSKRYRDWGTLKYLLRGIETCMPFVENVHLIVSRESQVPSWVDRSRLHVVLHEDIIPQAFLPTFNSTTIEMFMHRIEDLSERYLYFNDDMFPLLPCSEEDFYPDGKAAMAFSRHLYARGLYKRQTRNADRLARRILSLKPTPVFVRPQHTCAPMLRSACEEAFSLAEPEILASLSPLREAKNLNQYFFLDYMLHSGRAVSRRISNKHVSLAAVSEERLEALLTQPSKKLVCINDVRMRDGKAGTIRQVMLSCFEKRFPCPSRFESVPGTDGPIAP